MSRLIFILQIFSLSGIAFCEPFFEYIRRSPSFLVAHRISNLELLIIILVMQLILPAFLCLPFYFKSKNTQPFKSEWFNLLFLFLVSIIAYGIIRKIIPNDAIILILSSLLIGWLSLKLYLGNGIVKAWFNILTISIVILPLKFLSAPQILHFYESKSVNSIKNDSAKKIPIVILIFDELPLTTLLINESEIDQVLFPNFHELAAKSHWFRKAKTVSGMTYLSIPAILTGKEPSTKENQLPWFVDHPVNLFTVLSESHELKVFEQTTTLCPDSLCTNDLRSTGLIERVAYLMSAILEVQSQAIFSSSLMLSLKFLPNSISDAFGQIFGLTLDVGQPLFGPDGQFFKGIETSDMILFQAFLNSFNRNESTSLHFLHFTYPHSPFSNYPSGSKYDLSPIRHMIDQYSHRSEINLAEIETEYQRHILQTAHSDLLLGKLISKLKEVDLYDQAIIVVMSDHGHSFAPGHRPRIPDASSSADIIHIPLFIKEPNQLVGQVHDIPAHSVDIFPTVTSMLGLKFEDISGVNLFSDKISVNRPLLFYSIKEDLSVYSNEILYNLNVSQSLGRKFHLVGRGNNGPYRSEVFRQEIGMSINNLPTADVSINGEKPGMVSTRHVALASLRRPGMVSGTMKFHLQARMTPYVAIGVNGIIVAVSKLYPLDSNSGFFSVIVPEESFQEGTNTIEVRPIDE